MSHHPSGVSPTQLLSAIERATRSGVAAVDLDGVQTYVNPAFCDIVGFDAEELVGRRAPFPYWPAEHIEVIARAFEATIADELADDPFELTFVHKNGTLLDVQLRVGPIEGADGAVVGWVASAIDITARRRAESQLAEAQQIARIGSWEWHIPTGEVLWSAEMYRQFGRHPEHFKPTYESFLELVVEADLPTVTEALRRTLEDDAPYELEMRIQQPNQSIRVQQVRARVERSDDGQPIRLIGTSQDITEQKRLEQERLDETIHRIAISFGQELDEQKLLQRITDEATALASADFGALFFTVQQEERGDSFMLYTLSGAPREAFASFPLPRATPLFGPTFDGETIVRCHDVREDPRYGQWGPQPEGHLPVVSYLAVPVRSRAGDVLGGLFFGHKEPGRFTERHERLMVALAAHAAVALDNARLYGQLRASEDAAHTARAEAERTAAVLAEQRTVLELIASSAPLEVTLSHIIGVIEDHAGTGLRGSVLLLDADAQRLRHGAAPSLPAEYNEAIDGVEIGPQVGSCGSAAYDDREVLVTDIATDPLWADYKVAALPHGMRACWSTPVRSSDARVLGTFAIYYDEPRGPTEEERQLVDTLNRTASIAIERKQVEDALHDANRRKDEFLALLGHELRNPLAPILTALNLMALKGQAFQREREVIERQVRHMVQLVDDLLDISRITRGKVVLERKPLSLRSIVVEAAEMASPLIEERAHHLRIDLPQEELTIDGDQLRLAQVFANLLTNAAKYTEPGGQIVVSAAVTGDQVLVSVRDNGLGIAPQLLPHVFEPFTQGERNIDRSRGGLGLGLPLVRSLVTLHDGTVTAHSEGAGQGTEIRVRLPRVGASSVAPEAPCDEARAPSSATRHVLVVDDNTDAALLLAELLRSAGYEVSTAHDGPSALQLAEAHTFQAAVIDIGLPVMDGYELGRRLLARHALRLIALTGYGQPSDRQRSAEAGFAVHLVKPVGAEALFAALDTADPSATTLQGAGPAPASS